MIRRFTFVARHTLVKVKTLLLTDKPPEALVSFWNLPGIEAFTFIEKIQPYNERNVNDALRALAKLANIDKHRHLHVVNQQAVHAPVREGEEGSGPTLIFPHLSFDEQVLGEEMASARRPLCHRPYCDCGESLAALYA
jgi:hypothetical protein